MVRLGLGLGLERDRQVHLNGLIIDNILIIDNPD